MPVKVNKENDGEFPASQLKPGQIGQITKCAMREYQGAVVQRSFDSQSILVIGTNDGWSSPPDHIRVRVLPPGTLLEIT